MLRRIVAAFTLILGSTLVASPVSAAVTCQGAVTYVINAAGTAPATNQLCITVGGVVRVENLGPGLLSATPASRVSCNYAAGVHQCRLVNTGAVTVTVNGPSWTWVGQVDVVAPTDPPLPAPACTGPGFYSYDVSAGGPAWPAACYHVGSVVQFANNGPGGFTASPASAVSCIYAAGLRNCTLIAPTTVTFQLVLPAETRKLVVVAAP